MPNYVPAKTRRVDCTDIKDGMPWSSKRMADGDYRFTITAVLEPEENTADKWEWIFVMQMDSYPSVSFPYFARSSALGFLSAMYRAIGIKLPKAVKNLDPTRFVGKKVGGMLEQDQYALDNRQLNVSKISRVFPVDDVGTEPSQDGARSDASRPVPKAGGNRKAPAEDLVVDDSELDELDLDTL